MKFSFLPYSLNNFKIQSYYQNKPKFECVSSKTDLPKIKDLAYVINIDEYKSIGTQWIAMSIYGGNITFCDSFGVENFPKEI